MSQVTQNHGHLTRHSRNFTIFVRMKRLLPVLAIALAVSCGTARPTRQQLIDQAVDSTLASLTLEQKVWQLFTLETHVLSDTLYPVGGVILFGYDVKDSAQLKHLVDSLHALPSRPLISIDEEGGRVARIGRNQNINVPRIGPMGELETTEQAYQAGVTIGTYLKDFGIDIDFAPVADVNTNPETVVIGDRAFSSDPDTAALMVSSFLKGLAETGVYGCIKHFPGHGDTKNDTHLGYAQSLKTWEEMVQCEMIPFKAGIEAGTPLVMSAHISAPNVTGSPVPSTLSPLMLTEKLRGELGFDGVITTDALRMGAVAQEYTSAQAAVLALKAGADILLLPADPQEAFEGVMAAVADSTLTVERIDQSVRRILNLKISKSIQ